MGKPTNLVGIYIILAHSRCSSHFQDCFTGKFGNVTHNIIIAFVKSTSVEDLMFRFIEADIFEKSIQNGNSTAFVGISDVSHSTVVYAVYAGTNLG